MWSWPTVPIRTSTNGNGAKEGTNGVSPPAEEGTNALQEYEILPSGGASLHLPSLERLEITMATEKVMRPLGKGLGFSVVVVAMGSALSAGYATR